MTREDFEELQSLREENTRLKKQLVCQSDDFVVLARYKHYAREVASFGVRESYPSCRGRDVLFLNSIWTWIEYWQINLANGTIILLDRVVSDKDWR